MFQYSFSNNKQKSLDIVVCQGFNCLWLWAQLGSNQRPRDYEAGGMAY